MTVLIRRISITSFFALTLWLSPYSVHGGELSLLPEKGEYRVGEEFQIQVVASASNEIVSAVEAELSFDPNTLAIQSVSTEGSALSLWSKSPVFSNTAGTIQFSGWAQKNFTGKDQLLAVVTAKLLRAAPSAVVFNSAAMLSGGANTIISMKGGAYSAEPRSVPATPAPAEEKIVTPLVDDGAPAIAPPVFTEIPSSLAEGERIILRGTTAPNARVFIWTKENESSAVRFDTMSAVDGIFTYVSEGKVSAGTSFDIWAEAQTLQGVQSGPSSHVLLKTPVSGLAAAIALSDLPFPVYAWTAGALLVCLGLWWLFLYWKRDTN